MSRSWTIGALPDCDLVVALPMVSGRHCRLILDENGYSLEDLNSTNGTYVNGDRISGQVRIAKGDEITLGRTARMPWPTQVNSPNSAILRIGREPDNDFVIALPIISGHHAQVVWSGESGEATIEDLGSGNGTAVGSPDRKAARSNFRAGDTIYFGTHAVSASDLLARLESSLVSSVAEPSGVVPEGKTTDRAGSSARSTAHPTWRVGITGPTVRTLALVLQAPLVAFAICAAFRADLSANPQSIRGIASVLSWLGLAAIWFGLSDALIGNIFHSAERRGGPLDLAPLTRRMGLMGGLGILQCLIVWVIVASFVGLGGSWFPSVALLILASTVGQALGCLIAMVAPRPSVAWAALALVMVPLSLFGGGPQSLPRVAPFLRVISDAVPSRWAFEGLLLLESDRPEPIGTAEPARIDRAWDLAEAYFPANSERMGALADAMALVLMVIGFFGASVFISWNSRLPA
jgi:pSer/pThr/pTyr-binding forkhead associated (FHA) protein